MGWPQGVPFVHPHDLPNKAKQAFLEAYEPGWTAAQDGELGSVEAGQAQQAQHACKTLNSFIVENELDGRISGLFSNIGQNLCHVCM
jgi:hypothetical protein